MTLDEAVQEVSKITGSSYVSVRREENSTRYRDNSSKHEVEYAAFWYAKKNREMTSTEAGSMESMIALVKAIVEAEEAKNHPEVSAVA